MDICFNCPHCGQHLSVEEQGAGMIVNCPSCQQQIEIPHAAAPQVPVPTQLSGVAQSAAEQPPLVKPNPKPERVKYEASTNTFRGTMPQVLKLAMRAVYEVRPRKR